MSGSPALALRSLLFAAPLLVAEAAAQQGNGCWSPIPLGEELGTFAFDNTGFGTSGFGGGHPQVCYSAHGSPHGPIHHDVFLQWRVPLGGGTFTFETAGSPDGLADRMSVHAGDFCDQLDCVTTNLGFPQPPGSARIVLEGLVPGDTYTLQLGGSSAAGPVGVGLLTITQAQPIPGNDGCDAPLAIEGLGEFPFDSTWATDSGGTGTGSTACGFLPDHHDLFFLWTAPAAGTYRLDATGPWWETFHARVAVYDGVDCGAPCLASDYSLGSVAGRVWVQAAAGQAFLVQVSGDSPSQFGPGTLTIEPTVAPPANDDCSSALAVSGPGTWTHDATNARPSTFDGAPFAPGDDGCIANAGGTYAFHHDVFLAWTADAAGDYQVHATEASYPTYLNVHAGADCGASCLAFSGQGNSVGGRVLLLGVQPGDTFLVQAWTDGEAGPGVLHVTPWADPCTGVAPDAFEPNDTCSTAAPIADGLHPGLEARLGDPDLYAVLVPAGATLVAELQHPWGYPDLSLRLFPADACEPDDGLPFFDDLALATSVSPAPEEALAWTNDTGADLACLLEVALTSAGGDACNTYDLWVSGTGVGDVAPFCAPAGTNSTGGSVTLGSSSFTGPGLVHLEAVGGPPAQFGYVLVSAGTPLPAAPLSQGWLCLAPPIGRYLGAGALASVGRFLPDGRFENLSGTSSTGTGFDVPAALPPAVGGTLVPGSTHHFQLWYRDGAASNLSDGLSVTLP